MVEKFARVPWRGRPSISYPDVKCPADLTGEGWRIRHSCGSCQSRLCFRDSFAGQGGCARRTSCRGCDIAISGSTERVIVRALNRLERQADLRRTTPLRPRTTELRSRTKESSPRSGETPSRTRRSSPRTTRSSSRTHWPHGCGHGATRRTAFKRVDVSKTGGFRRETPGSGSIAPGCWRGGGATTGMISWLQQLAT